MGMVRHPELKEGTLTLVWRGGGRKKENRAQAKGHNRFDDTKKLTPANEVLNWP